MMAPKTPPDGAINCASKSNLSRSGSASSITDNRSPSAASACRLSLALPAAVINLPDTAPMRRWPATPGSMISFAMRNASSRMSKLGKIGCLVVLGMSLGRRSSVASLAINRLISSRFDSQAAGVQSRSAAGMDRNTPLGSLSVSPFTLAWP